LREPIAQPILNKEMKEFKSYMAELANGYQENLRALLWL
jgi:hypothetical protein